MQQVFAQNIFTAVLTVGIIQSVFLGLNNILDYRVPCQIIDKRNYGRLSATACIFKGIEPFWWTRPPRFCLPRRILTG